MKIGKLSSYSGEDVDGYFGMVDSIFKGKRNGGPVRELKILYDCSIGRVRSTRGKREKWKVGTDGFASNFKDLKLCVA